MSVKQKAIRALLALLAVIVLVLGLNGLRGHPLVSDSNSTSQSQEQSTPVVNQVNPDGGLTFGGTEQSSADQKEIICIWCGSPDCPALQSSDKSDCPAYDVEDDVALTCPICHKPTGDGTNGTCIRYLEDTTCSCGQTVEAMTCHSHE